MKLECLIDINLAADFMTNTKKGETGVSPIENGTQELGYTLMHRYRSTAVL